MRRLCAVLSIVGLCSCFSRVSAFAALFDKPAEHACCQPEQSDQSGASIVECCPIAAAHGGFAAPKSELPPALNVPFAAPILPPHAADPAPKHAAPPGPQSLRSAVPARAPPKR